MTNASNQKLVQVSARVEPTVVAAIERVAETERRPLSSVVRNVLADWAEGRREDATATG